MLILTTTFPSSYCCVPVTACHRVTCRAQGRQFTTGHARGRGCIALVLALLNWLPRGLYGLFYGKSPTRMGG